MINTMKKCLLVAFVAVFSTGLQAQTEQKISAEQLKKFVEVSQKVQGESMKQQQKMMKAIQDEGISPERFNQIYKAEQNPNKESDASGEEKKQYDAAMKKINAMNKQSQKDMEALIKKEGMKVETYMIINQKLQQDKSLQKRFRQIMSAQQPQKQPQPQMQQPN
jgi:Mg2+/Co2+ transporter CorB